MSFMVWQKAKMIVVSLESTQSFVINKTVNGEEITPFLNQFIKESYYFNNFYHQTGQGKTSDSEFIIENSLYPLGRGAVFFTHAQNEYKAIPEILTEKGYNTATFHANNKSFWSTPTKSFMGICSDFMSNVDKGNLAQSRFFCFFGRISSTTIMKHIRLPEHLSVFAS